VATLAHHYGWEVAEIAPSALQAIKAVPELDSRRDVSNICCGGSLHWITVGMNWGESPTDAFDLLNWLALVPSVLERLQLWAQEDYAAELQAAG
jgi:hypothetical protein